MEDGALGSRKGSGVPSAVGLGTSILWRFCRSRFGQATEASLLAWRQGD